MLRIFRKYYPIRNVIFAVGEGFIIFFAVYFACLLKLGPNDYYHNPVLLFKIFVITIICQISFYYNDLYNIEITSSLKELSFRLLQALGYTSIIFAFIYFAFPSMIISHGIFVFILILISMMIIVWRFGYSIILANGIFDQKIVVIGDGELAKSIVAEIDAKKDSGYQIVQFIDLSTLIVEKKLIDAFPIDPNKKPVIKKIIVALEEKRGKLPVKELLRCRTAGIDIIEGTSFYEMLMGKLYVTQINPAWLIFSDGFKKSKLQRFVKRAVDIFFSITLLIIFFPFFIVIALLIKLDSRGPVLFKQERIGQDRRPFTIYKFRSMVANAESQSGPVWAQDDDSRITRIGKVTRKLRIDELPQLLNVFKGEMSFVGPRPEREFFILELEKQIPYYDERFNVKPGITGWAQVGYGYGATIEDAIEKLNYDLFYIKNLSLFLDLMIVFRTFKVVLLGKGAR